MLYTQKFIDLISHVNRNTNRTALIGDGSGDRLSDPPGGVGAEFVPALVFEFLGRTNETDIAFLDQIEEGHPTTHVLLGNADHKTRVGGDQMVTGGCT